MPDPILRFYGRFVLAEEVSNGQPTGKTTFLAPNMTCGTQLAPHRPLMCVPRDAVSIDPQQTTIPPTMRTMTDGAPESSEYFIWDLSNCNVQVVAVGGLTLNYAPDVEIVDLDELETIQKRHAKLNKKYLSAGGPVSAAIELQAGVGAVSAIFGNECEFLSEADARDTGTIDVILRGAKGQADLVEITVPAPQSLAFVIADLKSGVVGQVVVESAAAGQVILSFTNLCAVLPKDQEYDFEFGQYYAVVDVAHPDRLIPKGAHLGSGGDCDVMSRIRYDK